MSTKTKIEKIEEILYSADYRKHGSTWFKEIDGHGLPLSSMEQEINSRGGRDCGSDAEEILRDEVGEAEIYLGQFSSEEIEDSSRLSFRRDFVIAAKAALSS